MKLGDYSGFSGWANVITRVLKRERGRQKQPERCDRRRAPPAIAGFEDGRRGHEPSNVGSL